MKEEGFLPSFLWQEGREEEGWKKEGKRKDGRREEGWKKRGRMEEEREDGRRALVHVVVNDGSLRKLQNLMEIN